MVGLRNFTGVLLSNHVLLDSSVLGGLFSNLTPGMLLSNPDSDILCTFGRLGLSLIFGSAPFKPRFAHFKLTGGCPPKTDPGSAPLKPTACICEKFSGVLLSNHTSGMLLSNPDSAIFPISPIVGLSFFSGVLLSNHVLLILSLPGGVPPKPTPGVLLSNQQLAYARNFPECSFQTIPRECSSQNRTLPFFLSRP